MLQRPVKLGAAFRQFAVEFGPLLSDHIHHCKAFLIEGMGRLRRRNSDDAGFEPLGKLPRDIQHAFIVAIQIEMYQNRLVGHWDLLSVGTHGETIFSLTPKLRLRP